MRPSHLLATALTLSSLSAAWPWPEAFGGVKALDGIENMFYRRDSSETTQQNTDKAAATTGATAAKTDDKAAATTDDKAAATTDNAAATTAAASASGTDTATGKTTGKTTGKSTGKTTGKSTGKGGSKTTDESAATTEYDPRLPAGGVSMITPNPFSGSQYYKIGDWVTFAWNYTSLSATPTAIDVLASCSKNSATYTIALNQSVKETGQVLWDTGAYQSSATVPLLTEVYTLIIYDADSSVSATARAGYLGTFEQFTFGMYSPQPYTPWSSYNCATCSGAGSLSLNERNALAVLLGTTAITVLSFTWFAGGVFGVL